jgi:carnitine O-acetyltransferase
MLACLADVGLYIQRLAILRFRLVSWLFVITTRRPQKALRKQIEAGYCAARAEGIARLYLGGRKSLALHNHFPVVLAVTQPESCTFINATTALIESLGVLAQGNTPVSNTLRMARSPARFCDSLQQPTRTAHFAILRHGRVFSISLALSNLHNKPRIKPHNKERLQHILATILSISGETDHNSEINGIRLGECTALPRSTWFKTHQSLVKSSNVTVTGGAKTSGTAVTTALEALKNAAFLVCMDDDTHPQTITDFGQALRYGNLHNRFFDKCIQAVVFGNGQCGLLCDHTVIDGVEAMQLAALIHSNMVNIKPSAEANVTNADLIPEHTPPWQELAYTLPPTLAKTELALLHAQIAKNCSLSLELPTFNKSYFDATTIPADTLIQLALQLSFFRCLGFLPSVFEPISLSHLPGGRLDFISPVSIASRDLINAMTQHQPIKTQHELLIQATSHHRQQIRFAKQGLGHIGHLLALSALEFPKNQRVGATWLRVKEAIFAKVDSGSRLLTQRDIVASNGGNQFLHAVKLFGTMTHRDDLFGIGYVVNQTGTTMDIQANGKYARHGNALADEFPRAVRDIASIAIYFLDANLAEAV